jgi:tetratricopeptide (TPR) repeat protein
MKALDKHYLSLQFKLKIHSKSATEFQSFFENIMEEAFDGFRKIPSGGGDGGNDGWIRSIGRYYQVYSPDVPATKDSEAAKKLKEDFDKLKKNWDYIAEIKEYYFVYNDKYAGAKKPEKVLSELRKENPNIKFDLFLAKDLEDVFFQLDESNILGLGFNIDQRIAISNGLEYLKKVEIELDREYAKYALRSLEDVEKIILTLSDNELLLEYKILECRCLQKLERVNEAIDKYNNVAKMYPDDPRALLYLSEIYLTQYDPDKNKELLEKAREIDSDFWLITLEDLVRKNNLDEEIDVSNIDEKEFPDSPREKSSYYRVFSSIVEKSGDLARAERFIEKAIHFNPERFINYTSKFSLAINRIFSNQDTSQRSEDLHNVLKEIDDVDAKFIEHGDIGPRNKAILNALRLHAFRFLENTQEYERIAQETFNLMLNCHIDKQIQQILASFLHVVSLPESDLDRLLSTISSSECKLSEELTTALIFQFNIHNKLFTVGKNFFEDKGSQKYYQLVVDIENGNDGRALSFLEKNMHLAFIMANTLKSFPKLRKSIIESLPDDGNVQKEKLMLLLNFDEKDFDEAFEILKTLDLSTLGYFECQPIFQIVRQKKAWDFEIIIIQKLIEKESDPKQIINLKLELFNALLNLRKYREVIDLGENILKEYFDEEKLGPNNEYILSNTILACFERGKVDQKAFERARNLLKKYELVKPTFEFKVGIEAEAYLHNDQPEKALESLIDGIKIKKVLSSTEYAKLYFLLCVRICGKIKLQLESLPAVTANSFVKLQGKDDWYLIGNNDELDAILINSANNKYKNFLDKKVGEQIVLKDEYNFGGEERTEIIEKIFPIEIYIVWKTIHNFNKLSQDGDLKGVQMVKMPKKDETVDPQYLLKFLEDLHSKSVPFFNLYCKDNNIPLAMLAVSEGGLASAIGKIQREQKGYINFSSGAAEDFENQKTIVIKVLETKAPFYIDATSALFLCEIGLLPKIISHLPGLKVPQSVINFLADISEKFRYTEGQMGSMGYVQGKISISSLEKEKSELIRSNFLKGIEILESNPDNVYVISEANKIECFPDMKIPAELSDACSLAQNDNTPVLTDDPLYLKMVELQTQQAAPEYFSSLALIRVLYEDGKLSFNEYLEFFGYLSSYRCRFLSLNSNDIAKATLGDKEVSVINVKNILHFNFPLTLSEGYGVAFNVAFRVVTEFFIKVILDSTVTFDVKEAILFQIIDSFPTDLNKIDFGHMILSSCLKVVDYMDKSLIVSINTKNIRREIKNLSQSIDRAWF